MFKAMHFIGVLKKLRREGLIVNVYFRSKFCKIKYVDIVPEFSDILKRFYKIKKPLHIGGKGFGQKSAINSCFGEIIERISLMSEKDIREFNLKNINLRNFFPYSEIKKYKLRANMKLPSVRLTSLLEDKKIDIPLELIFPNCSKRLLPKCSSSVGTAFGTNKKRAILSGIFEIIERHTILYYWYKNLSIPLLDNSPKSIMNLIEKIKKRLGVEVDIYSLKIDIPCNIILCKIKFGDREVFGCSADINLKKASKKAVAEALQLFISSKFINPSSKNKLERCFIKLLRKNPLYFSNSKISCKDYTIKDLFGYFKKSQIVPYSKEITQKEFSKYGVVYKIFIPQLLQFGSKNSIIFKKNYQLIGGRKEKKFNPFV